MAKILTKKTALTLIEKNLGKYYGVSSIDDANMDQIYKSVVRMVKDILLTKRQEFYNKAKNSTGKRIYYLCMEFLVGRSLKNNLYNLNITNTVEKALKEHNIDLQDLYDQEPDAGLGNGGLGRLASCYMDSLASLNYFGLGFSILYEYGLFKQKIVNGWQTELPDIWLPGGEVWLNERNDLHFKVKFDGHIEEEWTENGLKVHHIDADEIEAVAFDMMISGYETDGVSVLRLWKPQDIDTFDMKSFSSGDYFKATNGNNTAELISKVLYPADDHSEGKSLRLKQQYFLVSATIQNIVKDHLKAYKNLDNLHKKVAIHINDTHPALCIPELMRILLDEYHYDWDKAYYIVSHTVAYTNHTVMAEALETWDKDLIERKLPRIYQIIVEMNERFCRKIWDKYPGDWDKAERMAIISKNQIRMANLSVIGSHHVNGVSMLHSNILKDDVFRDFYEYEPDKFLNVTNGIAHRRWLCQANPKLTKLIDTAIGEEYKTNPNKLSTLKNYKNDKVFLDKLGKVKKENKKSFSNLVKEKEGILLNPDSMFITQAKRLHEYKRQLLNALRIVSLYLDLKDNPNMDITPQTFLFAAKAAPSYFAAKEVINLIVNLSKEIDKDPVIREKIKVAFLENYDVTYAESLMPASDVSEQISLAGKEASGTGNMKLMINGAITMGTMDGANVEIYESVGEDNIFIFGLRNEEVEALWKEGYESSKYYNKSEKLKRVVDYLKVGFNGEDFSNINHYLLVGNYGIADPYMCLADFEDYLRVHDELIKAYNDSDRWNKMSLMNIAGAGKFAADRAVKEYAKNIWNIKPLK